MLWMVVKNIIISLSPYSLQDSHFQMASFWKQVKTMLSFRLFSGSPGFCQYHSPHPPPLTPTSHFSIKRHTSFCYEMFRLIDMFSYLFDKKGASHVFVEYRSRWIQKIRRWKKFDKSYANIIILYTQKQTFVHKNKILMT